MNKINQKLSSCFPLIALVLSAFALIYNEPFSSLKGMIIPVLGAIMLSMGLTLKTSDFKNLMDKKGAVFIGVFIQFIIMPFAAYVISVIFKADSPNMLGMILVGASAGGTASNVICYLAGGNLALSVSMTSISTIFAVFLMPLLTKFYAGAVIEVPTLKMLVSLVQIVLIPVAAGMIAGKVFEKTVDKIKPAVPLFTILLISFIIAVIAALNKNNIVSSGIYVYLMVIIHNMVGLGFGYFVARMLKYDIITSRTIAIEVGMQNSGLSVAMAIKHFTAAAALPGAIFSIWHNISGSFLAGLWSRGNETEADFYQLNKN